MLFAQGAPVAPPPPPVLPPNFWAIMLGVCGCYLLIFLVILLIACFFCRTLYRVLSLCHQDNQVMSPGLAWLNLIPCFNYVWIFVTAIQVGSTLQNEFQDRNLDEGDTDYGRTVGLAFAGVSVGGVMVNLLSNALNQRMPFAAIGVSGLVSVVWLTLFVLYWVRIAGFGRQLVDDDEAHDRAADEADDRPPPEEPTDDLPR